MTVVERFLNYVRMNTISDPDSDTCPSTAHQFDLAHLLVEEMNTLGLSDVSVDENGYVMGTLESNVSYDVPVIGWVAHMDTSPDFTAVNVNPQIHENYDGQDIVLNKDENIVMSVEDFPSLATYKGQTLITTDGLTLLGADDKAGIAEILAAVDQVIKSGMPHGTIKVGFTPDEEIGRGADLFNVETFGADFAYTVDGGALGGIEFENFNAANAKVVINGRNIHPGAAKDKMINSVIIGMELNAMLPAAQRPEHTEMYEGFIHLNDFNGSVDGSEMIYILRDHDRNKFEAKKTLLEQAVALLNTKYGAGTVELHMKDAYYNMEEKVREQMHIVETAKEAMVELGIKPITNPVRGGTDGSRLSYMGLLTPNLFTGGANYHGRFEYIVKESMEASVDVIVKIIELYTKKGAK